MIMLNRRGAVTEEVLRSLNYGLRTNIKKISESASVIQGKAISLHITGRNVWVKVLLIHQNLMQVKSGSISQE
jgi:hypothetical protein